jgi:type I restriction-modification system DNA methylase subunit
MADGLRNNMDAAEYKHVVLGLIFLKYISDAFEAKQAELEAQKKQGADPEDSDEYRAVRIFWVPPEARWQYLKSMAPQPTIGELVDAAMTAVERDNPQLKGVLPKDFARAGLDKQRLGQIINLVSDIALGSAGDRAKDTLGRVYEYFLSRFASAEGKSGGQFYTPSHVVRVLVEMLAPYKGRVYDPCCGSGGMFVQSEKFIEAHSGKLGDISIYGQESNYTTWRLAKMNLAIRGIDAQIAHGDTFHNHAHPDLKADYVLANPPFNDRDWRGELLKDDKRWVYAALGVNSSLSINGLPDYGNRLPVQMPCQRLQRPCLRGQRFRDGYHFVHLGLRRLPRARRCGHRPSSREKFSGEPEGRSEVAALPRMQWGKPCPLAPVPAVSEMRWANGEGRSGQPLGLGVKLYLIAESS